MIKVKIIQRIKLGMLLVRNLYRKQYLLFLQTLKIRLILNQIKIQDIQAKLELIPNQKIKRNFILKII
jgi:hypothetical protein